MLFRSIQRIDFEEDGAMWVVSAKNGHGKTTLLELPKILYYGRLDKFKKDDIANRINKHAFITGEIEINPNDTVVIERTFSPTSLTVFKNGEDIGKSGISDYQSYIDTEVTGVPYHIFSNIVSSSINDFKSFISMTPNDKKIILDKLFNVEMLNKMNDLIKKDVRDIKINMELFDREMNIFKNNIDKAVKELKKLESKVTEDNTNKINEITEQLIKYKPKIEDGVKKLNEYVTKKNDILKSQNVFIQQKNNIEHQIKHIKTQINLFEQDKCPTCATPFNESRFESIKEQLHSDIKKKNEEIEHLKENEHKYNDALLKVNEVISKINNFLIQAKSSYGALDKELNRLKQDKPLEFESIKNLISDNTTKLKGKESDKEKFGDDYKYLTILEVLYNNDGVKKKIIESYLPTLNAEIEFTLNELHFPYSLFFNSDFEPEMNQLGIEINVDTLSEGEKKIVNISVLISIMRMMKHKYPNLNIFMLDEVLSSLDSDRVYDVVGVLRATSIELKLNIFVVSHGTLPQEFFSHRVNIVKNSGFSDLTIEKLE